MNRFGITLIEVESEGRDRDQDGWESDRWTVTLGCDGRTMRLPYRKGLGHNGVEPDLDEVLESLICDVSIFEDTYEMDDILGDLPYSKARKMAEALELQAVQLSRLLADDYKAFWSQDLYAEEDA